MGVIMVYLAALALAVLMALFILQLHRIIVAYRASTGTPWQKFLAAFSHSQTILLARVASFIAASVAWAVNLLPTLDPTSTIGSKIIELLPAQHATLYGLGFAVTVEVVRRLPGSVDPIAAPAHDVTVPPAPAVEVIPALPPAPQTPVTPVAVDDSANAALPSAPPPMGLAPPAPVL